MDLTKLSIEETLSQCSKPTGEIGIEVGKKMNEHHKPLLEWGLPILYKNIKKTNLNILDVGCGAGLAINLMSKIKPNSNFYGIDYSKEMVKSANIFNIELIKSGRVKIKHGSVEKLSFEDCYFDIVTASETTYFWPNLLNCIKSIYRTLKVGGYFAIINEDYYRNINFLNDHSKVMANSDKINFLKDYEHIALFEKAGFKNIRKHSIPSKGWITIFGTKG